MGQRIAFAGELETPRRIPTRKEIAVWEDEKAEPTRQ